MRVPTLQTTQRALEAIQVRQAEAARLQSQVASGLRVQSPGDDPVAAVRAERERSRLAHIALDQRANELSASILGAADGALEQGVGLLQSVREQLVAAGNPAYNASDRAAIAQQLVAARDQLLQLANSPDGAGAFLFAGQGSLAPPVAGNATPAWQAAAGSQAVGEGARYATTVDGQGVFMQVPQGNGVFATASAAGNTGAGWIDSGAVTAPGLVTGHTYAIAIAGAAGAQTYTVTDTTTGTTVVNSTTFTAGQSISFDGLRMTIAGSPAAGDTFTVAPAGRQSVFRTLDDAIALLNQPAASRPAYNEGLDRVQASLDRALDTMVLARSQVGAQLNAGDAATAANGEAKLAATAARSAAQDLDVADGVSQLQKNQTTLEAALRAYSGIARKTLFDMLG